MLRDERNPEKPLQTEDVDFNAGMLIPFMDPDNGVVFVFGRGDTVCKTYELREDEPPIMSCSASPLPEPIRAVAMGPKTCCDTSICEIGNVYIVTNSKHLVHFPMIVPRRNAETFQSDIYPDTVGDEPSVEFDAWKAGEEFEIKKVNLENYERKAKASSFQVEEQEDPAVLKQKLNEALKTIEENKARIAELEKEIATLKGSA